MTALADSAINSARQMSEPSPDRFKIAHHTARRKLRRLPLLRGPSCQFRALRGPSRTVRPTQVAASLSNHQRPFHSPDASPQPQPLPALPAPPAPPSPAPFRTRPQSPSSRRPQRACLLGHVEWGAPCGCHDLVLSPPRPRRIPSAPAPRRPPLPPLRSLLPHWTPAPPKWTHSAEKLTHRAKNWTHCPRNWTHRAENLTHWPARVDTSPSSPPLAPVPVIPAPWPRLRAA